MLNYEVKTSLLNTNYPIVSATSTQGLPAGTLRRRACGKHRSPEL